MENVVSTLSLFLIIQSQKKKTPDYKPKHRWFKVDDVFFWGNQLSVVSK